MLKTHLFSCPFGVILHLAFLPTLACAEDALPTIHPGYKAGDYKFKGRVETISGGSSFIHTFSGETTKATFTLRWQNDMGFFKHGGTVTIDGKGGKMSMKGMEDMVSDDPEMAIASATGVSAGSAHLMYSLWKGAHDGVFPTEDIEVAEREGKMIVSGNGPGGRSELTLKDGILVSVTNEYDPKQHGHPEDQEEMTDEDLGKALKAMGKPVTEEEIAGMRKMLKDAEENLAAHPGKILSVTKIEMTSFP